MNPKLIAPCGMNCAICLGYLREKNKCPGCKEMSENKPFYCRKCIIANCEILKKNKWKYCSDKCEKFPCKRLKSLLKNIKKLGVRQFVKNEKVRWTCKKCESILCVHRDVCQECGEKR